VTAMPRGFHAGELAVQQRAGVADQAERLTGMLAEPDLDGGAHHFLAGRTFAVITARDAAGNLWCSPLTGPAGFLDGRAARLDVHAVPRDGDPLAGLPAGQPVGLVAIEFAARRRLRVNGTLVRSSADGLTIDVEQAYGNCPKYIHPRPVPQLNAVTSVPPERRLGSDDEAMVRAADTFFLGTSHPTGGADASHRGGPAGFVRLDGGVLRWPDFPGNNMFNSLGNLAVDPTASLLFIDFVHGRTLQLTGDAELEWTPSGRGVRFVPTLVVGSARTAPSRLRSVGIG
jgi:uncharacterized protein